MKKEYYDRHLTEKIGEIESHLKKLKEDADPGAVRVQAVRIADAAEMIADLASDAGDKFD